MIGNIKKIKNWEVSQKKKKSTKTDKYRSTQQQSYAKSNIRQRKLYQKQKKHSHKC